jgi:hypothetical protein
VEIVRDVRVDPIGVSAEPTADERVAEASGPLSLEHDALANLVAVVIAHTRATAAEVRVRDAQLNRLLDAWGIGNVDEFNGQVGKHLDDLQVADHVRDRRFAGWELPSRPWDSLYAGIALAILLCWVVWEVVAP